MIRPAIISLLISTALHGQQLSWPFLSQVFGQPVAYPCEGLFEGGSLACDDVSPLHGGTITWQGIEACYDEGMRTSGWEVLPNDSTRVLFPFLSTEPVYLVGVLVGWKVDSVGTRIRIDLGNDPVADVQVLDTVGHALVEIPEGECITTDVVIVRAYNSTQDVTIRYLALWFKPCVTTGVPEDQITQTRPVRWYDVDGRQLKPRP